MVPHMVPPLDDKILFSSLPAVKRFLWTYEYVNYITDIKSVINSRIKLHCKACRIMAWWLSCVDITRSVWLLSKVYKWYLLSTRWSGWCLACMPYAKLLKVLALVSFAGDLLLFPIKIWFHILKYVLYVHIGYLFSSNNK